MTAATENGSTAVILDWLASQPGSDLFEEIGALSHHLDLLASPVIAAAQQHRCIELFHSRSLRIAADLKPRLIEAGLPLERLLHALAQQFIDALISTAQGFLQTVRHVQSGTIRDQPRLIETLAARGIRLLAETYEISHLAGGAATPSLWPTAVALFEAGNAAAGEGAKGESALLALKRLAAIACIQLQRLSQSEIVWTRDYLDRIATLIQIEDLAPDNTDTACFWIACDSDDSPQSVLRKTPTSTARTLYISLTALTRRIAEHLSRFEAGQPPRELNLGPQPIALLQRLYRELAVPAKREQARRKSRYPVHACAGIPAIWQSLRDNDSEQGDKLAQEWQVTNESPGGFSIVHVASAVTGLNAGMAISLRGKAEGPWTICIVRWIRSETPERVELGLQIVSTGATTVMIGFRGSLERPNRMVKALVLPALPALRHHPAVIVPAGTHSARRFSLVSDLEHVYIAQGRLLSLDIQTADIELFQFEIDPYPI